MTDPYQTLLLGVDDDGVATLTLNRPEAMNAWNDAMAGEIDRALRRCDADDAVRAVVITGAGRAFCAGADLGRGGETFRPAPREAEAPRLATEALWPFQMKKPVIAAINGHAIGVGITFPMTCDLRYVAEDARIQFAFVRRGVIPELASHAIVPRVIGLSHAADLLLSGRMISGREAAALGLASKALPAAEVLPAALAHARELRLAAPASGRAQQAPALGGARPHGARDDEARGPAVRLGGPPGRRTRGGARLPREARARLEAAPERGPPGAMSLA
jgi:enoyl-CoA hydratase/carnithine racemase